MAEQAAQAAYEAYGTAVEWRSVTGAPMPRWEDLGDRVQRAWAVATDRVQGGVSGPLRVWWAVLAGLQAVAGAGDLADLLPPVAARWVQLLVGAAGVATVAYAGRSRA